MPVPSSDTRTASIPPSAFVTRSTRTSRASASSAFQMSSSIADSGDALASDATWSALAWT